MSYWDACLQALSRLLGPGKLCLVHLHFVGPAEQRGAAAAEAQAGSGGCGGPSHGRDGGAVAAAG